jgi:hypothetical protein
MVGFSINDSTRTAATDGALSFSVLLNTTRELTLGTAQSTVSGLLTAIREAPASYADLLNAATDAVETQTTAAEKLVNPPWESASQATLDAIRASVDGVLASLIAAQRALATTARDSAANTAAGAADPSTERTLATDVATAGDLLLTALGQLETNNDATGATTLADARSQAAAALASAQTHLADLQSQDPLPAARIAQTQATIAAAQSIIAVVDTVSANTFVGPAGQAPTTYRLKSEVQPETYVSVWGSSGAISLTDANGNGILITSDGKVDTIPPGGAGWQFTTDSTFLLPDGTKVSFEPGSPASVLLTRGQQRITIDSLAPGQTPSVQQQSGGGLAADKNRNDGHIFEMSGGLSSWTLAGSALGDVPGSREVVATTPLTNEREVDVTLTPLPNELVAFLANYGIDPTTFDTDGDGLYSSKELQVLVATLDAAVGGLQTRFDSALSNSIAALESLLKLNQFLESILEESERRDANRRQLSAEQKDQVVVIQREIAAALAALRSDRSSNEAKPTLVGDALAVLEQVEATPPPAPPTSGFAPTPPRDPVSPPPVPPQSVPSTPPAPQPPPVALTPVDPGSVALAQSFRRAERLLSGFGDGLPALRFAPATPPATPLPPTPPTEGILPGLETLSPTDTGILEQQPALPGQDQEATVNQDRGGPPPTVRPFPPPPAPQPPPAPAAAPDFAPPPPTFGEVPRPPTAPPAVGIRNVEAPPGPPLEGVPAPTVSDRRQVPPGEVQGVVKQPFAEVVPAVAPPSSGPVPSNEEAPALDAFGLPTATPPLPPSPPPRLGEIPGPPPLSGVPQASTPPTSRPGPAPQPGGGPVNVTRGPQAPVIGLQEQPPARGLGETPSPSGETPEPVPTPTPPLSLADVLAAAIRPRQPNGLQNIPGSRFSAVGPDPAVAPDTTFGASDGFRREFERRLDQHRSAYEASLQRSGHVQVQVRQVVERFLVLVGQDEELRKVFTSDDLSDEQQVQFKEKVQSLERELGVAWGVEPEKTPQGEANLSNRLLKSGLMI